MGAASTGSSSRACACACRQLHPGDPGCASSAEQLPSTRPRRRRRLGTTTRSRHGSGRPRCGQPAQNDADEQKQRSAPRRLLARERLRGREALRRGVRAGQATWTASPAMRSGRRQHSGCHSSGTPQPSKYSVLCSKELHELGAPLRNRTVDLLLTISCCDIRLMHVMPSDLAKH